MGNPSQNSGEPLAQTPPSDSLPPLSDETIELSPQTASDVAAAVQQTPAEDAQWIGRTIGKYVVTAVLGKGGMGVVLKAHDPLINRSVAIKVLADRLAADSTALARFLSEARAAGQLNHPHVAAIYEVGQEGNAHYLVMEFLPGGSLADRLQQQGALSLLEATLSMVQACKGIGAAHHAGLVHRDLKPANFLRSADGSVKVTDFGLAKTTSSETHQLTQAGTVMGTPFFMSPEQCQGTPVDSRSDIYSLGATYYSLLTGKNPYQDSTGIPQVMFAHCHGEIPDPHKVDPSVPTACSRIVAKAMAKEARDRYQSIKELLVDLEMVAATLSGQTLSLLPSESGGQPVLPSISAELSAHSAPTLAAAPLAPPAGRGPSRRMFLGGAAVVGLLLTGFAGFFVYRGWFASAPQECDPAATGPVVATPTGEPIKIGILHSLSGTMADSESAVVDALLFAIEEVNQAGGVMGRPLKAVVADGESDDSVFAREAARLIDEEKVNVLFGCWTSSSRKTVKPIVEDRNHLLFYSVQYEGLETSPNVVYLGATPNQQILPAIDWAAGTLGKKRFYMVGSDYVFPRVAGEIIKDRLKELDVELVGEDYLRLGETNVGPLVERIREARPDVILNTINGDTNIAFFRELHHKELSAEECPVISFSIDEAGLRRLPSSATAGHYTSWTYTEGIETPENQKFVTGFHERNPHQSITDPMESSYVALKLWAAAANNAKSIEPAIVRRAILEERFPSPSGEVRIDPGTLHRYLTPRIEQLKSGRRPEIVFTAPAALPPDPFPDSRSATAWLALLDELFVGWGNHWSAPSSE